MTIRQLITGCLQKLSSEPSDNVKVLPNFPMRKLEVIRKLQKENSKMLLCGSAALILKGTLPRRPMHDIDFVINRKHFDERLYWLSFAPYGDQGNDGYTSYEHVVSGARINVLVFDDNIKLKSEKLTLYQGAKPIKCQNFDDIMNWKKKYNRPKDIKDLNKITSKAFEDALFSEE